MASFVLALLLALATCTAQVAGAAPFRPERDDEVLELLPAALLGEAAELRRLRAALAGDPGNFERAAALAWRFVAFGRAESDPRAFGWAEGVLAPWLAQSDPPSEALLLRATLRQNRHDFARALGDLERALARDPRDARAWHTRAVILGVRGDPRGAERACRPLLRLADPLTALSCLANAAGLGGRGERGLALLEGALASAPEAPAELQRFALTSLAELAARLGRDASAEQAFARALALGGRDVYLLAARADFLLERGRPSEVVALLAGETRADGLLLRLALAERQLGADELAGHMTALRARFAAGRARGESVHLGEEARFALALEGDAAAALALASRNFGSQKEPRDARILLEAALAASEPAAARPALDWMAATGIEDAALARLAAGVAAL